MREMERPNITVKGKRSTRVLFSSHRWAEAESGRCGPCPNGLSNPQIQLDRSGFPARLPKQVLNVHPKLTELAFPDLHRNFNFKTW